MIPRDDRADDFEAVKRRWIVLFSVFLAIAGLVNTIVGVMLDESVWIMVLVVTGAAATIPMSRRGLTDSALVLQAALAFLAVGHTHVTSEAGDTGPFYVVPVVLMAMLFLPSRARLPALAVASLGVLAMRLMNPFDDPYATSHTVDVLVVTLGSAGIMWRGRLGWESSQRDLVAAMEQLRAAEQSQRRLREAAEESSRAKTRFLANMSHELRTPLNAVLGYAEMLAEAEIGATERRDAERIHAAGSHLLGIVDDVLDLARVDSGGRTVVPQRFELEELGEEVAEWIGPTLGDQGNLLIVDMAPATMWTDHLMVRQILLNLLGNANKFCTDGTIQLRSELRGDIVVIEVEDSGIGMAPDEVARVLEPFTQGNHEILARYGGSGLGLSIVDRFVRALGGSLGIDSRPGAGTTFTVHLPCEVAAPASPLAAPQTRPAEKTSATA